MNGRYERDDLEDMHEAPAAAADREISLGTGGMLGIFFALVLVCGAFFGFGYSMGHKTTPVVAPAGAGTPAAEADAAVGEAADSGTRTTGAAPTVVVKPSAAAAPVVATKKASVAPVVADRGETAAAPVANPAAKVTPKPYITVPTALPPNPPAATGAAPAVASAGTIFVQISAVSHQEDALSLTTALKRRGYEAMVRHSPGDPLLHVQVGPFATKKEADAMRLRLSADGYNAILK